MSESMPDPSLRDAITRRFAHAIVDNEIGHRLDVNHENPDPWIGLVSQLGEGEVMVAGLATTDMAIAYPLDGPADLQRTKENYVGRWQYGVIRGVPAIDVENMQTLQGDWSSLETIEARFRVAE